MTARLQSIPGTFPLHEDKNFFSESEWVILQLLCRKPASLVSADADELSKASGNQLSPERCRDMISIMRIAERPGLGSWMARLMVEAGLSEDDLDTLAADELAERINKHMGYAICNTATSRALAGLQDTWRNPAQQEPR
ncbi:MAG: hypothetical protein Q9M30_09540 [Mariprofundaceae bacterium]|nr:hypothetical protein [Mariprofundaceae bacterium]